MKPALRIYAWALRLYPRDFQPHSQTMLETYTDALRDAVLHKRLPAFHCHMTLDLISSLPAAHLQGANMTIWIRRLLVASSLIFGLLGFVLTLSMWSEQTIQFPITITSGQYLEPRVALWWTLQQWMPVLGATSLFMLAIFAIGSLALGVLEIKHLTLERRWAVSAPFVIALLTTLIFAFYLTNQALSEQNKILTAALFSCGWIALAGSLWHTTAVRRTPDLSSPRA